jgi:hypothetical protein
MAQAPQAHGRNVILLPEGEVGGLDLDIKGAGEIPRGRLISRGEATSVGYDYDTNSYLPCEVFYRPGSGLELRHGGIAYVVVAEEDVLATLPLVQEAAQAPSDR